jgi:hypothetical protein
LQLQLQSQNQLQLQYLLQLQFAVPVAVVAVEPVAITLEVFGNDYRCYQMEPLPANAIRGMYSHMVNG